MCKGSRYIGTVGIITQVTTFARVAIIPTVPPELYMLSKLPKFSVSSAKFFPGILYVDLCDYQLDPIRMHRDITDDSASKIIWPARWLDLSLLCGEDIIMSSKDDGDVVSEDTRW